MRIRIRFLVAFLLYLLPAVSSADVARLTSSGFLIKHEIDGSPAAPSI